MDILAAIDAAIGCQQCGGPLGRSPSTDFCSDECQRLWHAAGTVELPDADGAAGFRLPRSTSDLRADWQAARRAEAAATSDAQRAAVRWRIRSLNERERAANLIATAAMWPAMEAAVQRYRLVRDLMASLRGSGTHPADDVQDTTDR